MAHEGTSKQHEPKRMSGWDFATWRAASTDPTMRSTIMGVMVLDRAPDWKRLRDRYERASRLVPILRTRVVEGPVAIANPRLVIDPDFDLDFHLMRFRMPAGSGWKEVLDEARRQSMSDFDRDRPLWMVTLLEGLPGGKSVLLSKLHHAVADGQAALQLGAVLVDLTPEGYDLGPMPPVPTPEHLNQIEFAETMVHDNVDWVAQKAAEIIRGAIPHAAQFLASPREKLHELIAAATSIMRFAQTPMEALSPVAAKRSINYHFATFDVPFAELRDAAKASGNSLNDAFMAAVAFGMGGYHEFMDSPVDKLNVSMPISLRKAGEIGKNAVNIARFDLPTAIPDPHKLMDTIGEQVKAWRAEPALGFADQFAEISRFVPHELVTAAAKASDVTASNVPGPPIPVWMAGAKVERMYPLPPTIGAAVFVALLSYDGNAAIGLALDDAAISDQPALVKSMIAGFEKIIGKPLVEADPLAVPPEAPVASDVAPAAKKAATKRAPAKAAAKRVAPTRAAKKAPAKPAAKRAPAKPAAKKAPAKAAAKKVPAKPAAKKAPATD